MSAKHTPGPWAVEYVGTIAEVVNEETLFTVATCGSHKFGVVRENARLIAAAPETAAERDRLKEINAELLDELRKARLLLKNGRMKKDILAIETVARIDGLIAKATGQ